jgi:hypothetical protein
MEHQVQELTAFIMSHSDPVLKSHLEDLNNAAVPVMKKHDGVLGWQDRYMAVRRGTLFYADTYKAVKSLADSRARSAGEEHVIDVAGCSVTKCPEETDKAHFAFVVATSQVNSICVRVSCLSMPVGVLDVTIVVCTCEDGCVAHPVIVLFFRGGSCFGPPASQHSEWPSWRPSAAALRPLPLRPLPLPLRLPLLLISKVQMNCAWNCYQRRTTFVELSINCKTKRMGFNNVGFLHIPRLLSLFT